MGIKISIIIPVYNKAPFLKRCLDSLKNQYSKPDQIIIVDDGSTDGSDEICDNYAERCGWEIYHTENNGVSEARNLGIKKAKGEYITFLDADDLLIPDAVAVMTKASESGFGIYQFGQYRCRSQKDLDWFPYKTTEGYYHLDYIPRHWVLVWNKLYKRSLIEDNGIKFKKGMQFGEDALFNMECILANNGLYNSSQITVIHCLDDTKSLCRGHLNAEKIKKLDNELAKLSAKQTEPDKISWVNVAVAEHRKSRLFRKFQDKPKGKHDVVYFIKDTPDNEELRYSLRSLEKNWRYKNVWFCGGCPRGLVPDRHFKLRQEGMSKWDRVRNMLRQVCENNDITEDFWLFNDDFFILKPISEDMLPQFNGNLQPYIERIDKRHGGMPNDYTSRLKIAVDALQESGKTTFNYEVHKPMLISRKKALEVLDKFEGIPAFRSLYGNYFEIGGESKHDMKIEILNYGKMDDVKNIWEFLSTSDESFEQGMAGQFIRESFKERSRFEK